MKKTNCPCGASYESDKEFDTDLQRFAMAHNIEHIERVLELQNGKAGIIPDAPSADSKNCDHIYFTTRDRINGKCSRCHISFEEWHG